MKKLLPSDWFLLSRIARRLRGLKERTTIESQRYDLQKEIDSIIKVFVYFDQTFDLHPLTVDTHNLESL